MKKSLAVIMIGIMFCLTVTGCKSGEQSPSLADKLSQAGDNAEEEKEEKKETETEEAAGSKEEPPREEDGVEKDEKSEEAVETDMTEDECREEIDMLRKTKAVHPAQTEILAQMAGCVTFSRILDENGMIFSQADNNIRAALRHQIIDRLLWEESDFFGAIPVEEDEGKYNADRLIPVEAAEGFFKEIYGEEDFTPAEYENVEDGYILYSFGDGDPWHIVEHMQFYEDDGFILFTGPAFYEDNGGCLSFMGYADILFKKNPESRYGATLLYGRYRDEKINVVSVDTSSQLPDAAGKSYSGMNLVDGDYTTVWSEGVPGTGLGETITIHLDKEQPVYGVMICNGYTADYNLYTNNGKLTKVDVDFGSEAAEGTLEGYAYEGYTSEDLADNNRSRIELDEPVMTDTVTITVLGADSGARYDDTCVSEIRVY